MFGGANIEFFLHMQVYFPGFLKFALMKNNSDKTVFDLLIKWYWQHKRPLPWRKIINPYHIYISEIVFQQTRIDQGILYYKNIIQKYPDFDSLAAANEKDFLNVWQGLGYYSRAHNMLKAAAIISQHHHGQLPADYNLLLTLPGIGPYTAAAIASIAFNLPHPVIDGNVKRVISRIRCIGIPSDKTELAKKIQDILNNQIQHFNPSDFNQALMDFGAMVCTPSKPSCKSCPINNFCCAFKNSTVEKFPVKKAAKTKPIVYINYYVVFSNNKKDCFYMLQRNDEKIWKGLYEFPCVEQTNSEASVNLSPKIFPSSFAFNNAQSVFQTSHILTHRNINASFLEIVFNKNIPSTWIKVKVSEAHTMPVHRLIQQYLEQMHQQKKQ